VEAAQAVPMALASADSFATLMFPVAAAFKSSTKALTALFTLGWALAASVSSWATNPPSLLASEELLACGSCFWMLVKVASIWLQALVV
jgi:hypothetical protein